MNLVLFFFFFSLFFFFYFDFFCIDEQVLCFGLVMTIIEDASFRFFLFAFIPSLSLEAFVVIIRMT